MLDVDDAVRVCRERGWAVAYVEEEGFRPCLPEDPGAYVDLDRYVLWQRRDSQFHLAC